MRSPPEAFIAEASDTLAVPSNVCTTSEGLGMFMVERTDLSKYSIDTFISSDNSCNPFTSASFLIDANFVIDLGLRLNLDIQKFIPSLMVSFPVSQCRPTPTTSVFGL